VAYSGGDVATAPLVWPWILWQFCTVFVSFVSQLSRKIRVPRLVRIFRLLKTASKCTHTHHFGGLKWFVSGDGPSPSTTPTPLTSAAPHRPLLTKILNTPLVTVAGNVVRLQVIDFGSSCYETDQLYAYVQSRFYRAPEVRSVNAFYNLANDTR